jgi:hypothetical protein
VKKGTGAVKDPEDDAAGGRTRVRRPVGMVVNALVYVVVGGDGGGLELLA